MNFVNRRRELDMLDSWWRQPGGRLGMVWGRRRVGKTALVEHFASDHRTIFHTFGGRPSEFELRLFSERAEPIINDPLRNLCERPFRDWDEALELVGRAARSDPILVVLDGLPDALQVTPHLPGIIRAQWDRLQHHTQLRLLVCGSAVRTMEALQRSDAPLYGRLDLRLLLAPFTPAEVGEILTDLTPGDRALVWGIVGGTPLYLSWWDQRASVDDNLMRLGCQTDSRLLAEGEYVLEREMFGDLGREVLHTIANGRTKFNEIADVVRTDPSRTLERLIRLGLIERALPVTDDARPSRRRIYRIIDNFLGFWLSTWSRYRTEIERGLGAALVPAIRVSLDNHMGRAFEDAFRDHLVHLARQHLLGEGIVGIGRFWRDAEGNPDTGTGYRPAVEIDAVVLSGTERRPVILGEAKWAHHVDGTRVRRELARKARWVPGADPESLQYAVCAREEVRNPGGLIALTAADVFPSPSDRPSAARSASR